MVRKSGGTGVKLFSTSSIRTKLLGGYSLLFFVVFAIGSAVLYLTLRRHIENQIENELRKSTVTILNMVRTMARSTIRVHLKSIVDENLKHIVDLHALTLRGELSTLEAMALAREHLIRQKIGKTGYIFVWDIRKAPEVIPLAVHPVIQGTDVAYVDFVQEGAKLKQGYMEYSWANPGEKQKRKKSMYLGYFKPWHWVIAASSYREEFLDLASTEDFRDSIRPMSFGETGYSFVIDLKGNVIIHPKLKGNFYNAKDEDGLYFIREMVAKKKGRIVYRWKNPDEEVARKKLCFYRYLPEYEWIVAASSYYEEFYSPLDRVRNIILVTVLVLFALILPLTMWIGRSITTPIQSLMEGFARGAGGDFGTRISMERSDELGELARFFNVFMERLQANSEELLQSNRKLLQEKERILTTLRSINEGVIVTDSEGRLQLMNTAAERIIELSQEDAMGREIGELMHIFNEQTGNALENPVMTVIKSGGSAELGPDTRLLGGGGDSRFIQASAAPVRDPGGTTVGTVLVIRDLTAQRKMELELEKALKIESLGVFAGGIAHDFNNLLTSIMGNISLAKVMKHDDEELLGVLDDAEKASLHARELTQQLLTFSRGGEPIRKVQSVAGIIKESAEFILSGSKLKLEDSIEEGLWNVSVDAGQFSQVIYNIVLNSRQIMPEGGTVKIDAGNVHLGPEEGLPLDAGPYVKITITDNGPGMTPDVVRRIFDPYFTTRTDGSGLGLSICFSIIRRHGGFLEARSEPGKGASFIIYIPATLQDETDFPEENHVTVSASGRVLVMDDEESVRATALRMLEKMGFTVTCSREGEEAVAAVEEVMASGDRFRFAIMDLTVPGGMGGKDALVRVKEIDPELRVIVSSGYSNDPVMANYREYGFDAVMVKPYRFEDMNRVISGLMGEEA